MTILDLVFIQYLIGSFDESHLRRLEAFLAMADSALTQRKLVTEIREGVLLLAHAPLDTHALFRPLPAELRLLLDDLAGRLDEL